MSRTLSFLIKLAITSGLLAVLFLYFLPFDDFIRLLGQLDPLFFGLLVLTQFLRRFFAAVQVTVLLEQMNDAVRFWRVFRAQNLGIFYSFFTPGEVGVSLVTFVLLARETLRKGTVLSCLAYVRILRYAALALFAGVGLILEPRLLEYHVHYFLLALFLLLALAFLFFHVPAVINFFHRRLGHILLHWTSKRLVRMNRHLWNAFAQARHISPPALAKVVVAIVLAQCTAVAGFYCAQYALGLNLPWTVGLWLASVITILTALPISFSGLGVREMGVAALLFALYQTPVELATTLSLVIFGSYALMGIILGAGLSLTSRKPTAA